MSADQALAGGTSIPLVDHWDATLSYDVLEPDGADRQVEFVGRNNLKGALVTSIADPDARGSVLVSGYRGAGKTTLVIEAARLAKLELQKAEESRRWELFPLSINVSEVAASMTSAVAAPEAGSESPSLRIHPNLLLTALIRELANRVDHVRERERALNVSPDSKSPVADHIVETFDKAVASTWSKEDQRSAAERMERRSERTGRLELTSITRTVVTLALGVLSATGVIAAGQSVVAIVAAAAAAVLAMSIAWNVTTTRTTSDEQTSSVVARYDKSVHQLETDLKDILAGLNKLRLRTVVIIEELDKIDSAGDLEAVIKYFKNLFTQAPALFFFITDKEYFDHVSSEIKRKRRGGSYAIEHTFFTRRVYVGRPSADDCLDFLCAVMKDDADRDRVRALKGTEKARSRPLESMDRFEQFVRYLLFKCDNHLFDLKNEMRRFVRAHESGPVLEFDDVAFPSDEAAIAAFQFLAQSRTRSYWFGPGSAYASELLHDTISSVFFDVDAEHSQAVPDLLARTADPTDGAVRADAIAEQLTLSQLRRIQTAVESLVGELQRGGAIVRTGAEFAWERPAARNFRPAPDLEEYERALADRLAELQLALRPLATGGTLAARFATTAESATTQSARLAEREQEVREVTLAEPINANDAAQEMATEEEAADGLLEGPYAEHSSALNLVSMSSPLTRSLYEVYGLAGATSAPGVLLVLVAYGRPSQVETTARRIWSELETRAAQAAGIVWVDPTVAEAEAIGPSRARPDVPQRMSRLLAVEHAGTPGAVLPAADSIFEALVPLGPPGVALDDDAAWITPAVDALIEVTYLASGAALRGLFPDLGQAQLARRRELDEHPPEVESMDLDAAISRWWGDLADPVLWCPAADRLRIGAAVATVDSLPPLVADADALLGGGGLLEDRIRELLGDQRLVVSVQPGGETSLPAGGRAIVFGAAPTPDDLELRLL